MYCLRLIATFLLFQFPVSAALACGPDTNCQIGERTYRIAMPEGHDGTSPVGALVWSHGFRGSAQGAMRNGSLRRMVSDAGLAFIAAQGIDGTWDLPFGPRTFNSTGASEYAYFDALVDDVSSRFSIDRERVIVSGFSAGGMMVWYLACMHPDRFAGFIPMSGTYWLKPPQSCHTPASGTASSIVHIHGDADSTVPLTGRVIRETKQGEVAEALATYEEFGGFGTTKASTSGNLECENRSNPTGDILEFCLFPGGHSFSTQHLKYGIERLRAAGQI